MKLASLPPVRVDQTFRDQVESVLREGETLTSFIEATVAREVEHRRICNDFDTRAERSWQEFQRTGVSYSLDEVFNRIDTKIEARRKVLLARK